MPKKRPNVAPKSAKSLRISLFCFIGLAIFLLTLRIAYTDSTRYIFLYWNLVLAVVAPLLAWWFTIRYQKWGWKSPSQVVLLVGWLLFLPNSFYILTDYIHLRQTFEVNFLFDVALFSVYSLCGLVLGYMSVYMIHQKLLEKLSYRRAWYVVLGVLLMSSFAMYLGRFSRWNTWDIIFAPAGLLFDVSERVVNPIAHSDTYTVTAVFFMLLVSLYWVMWESAQYLKAK